MSSLSLWQIAGQRIFGSDLHNVRSLSVLLMGILVQTLRPQVCDVVAGSDAMQGELPIAESILDPQHLHTAEAKAETECFIRLRPLRLAKDLAAEESHHARNETSIPSS